MAPPLSFDALFDPAFLARLQPFSLSVAMADKGGRLAEQKTAARGQGSDFADFKPYVAGDDLRAIDWNIYRRLGRVFVRVFEETQDLPVYFVVDVSGSMFLETPPRIHPALRVTLALAAIALGQHDSVGLFPFAEAMTVQARAISGKSNVARVARHLAEYQALGRTELAASIERLATMKLRRGLMVIVSDFFDDAGLEAVLDRAALLPHRLLLVQIVKPQDADPMLDPALHGDLLVEDGETQARAEVTITPELIAAYTRAYRAFSDRLAHFASERGAALARIDADRDVLDQLSDIFASGQVAL